MPVFYTLVAFFLAVLGTPAFMPSLGIVAAGVGYAFFFLQIIDSSPKKRFWQGTIFFALVQLALLSWFTSHPYLYIYGVWIALAFLFGLQFGILSLFCTRKRLSTLRGAFFISLLWAFFEWSRLFLLSGFTFNPIGLALSTNEITLQLAALIGIYGLSFWVMLTNTLVVSAILGKTVRSYSLALLSFIVPLLFGSLWLSYHEKKQHEYDLTHAPFRCLIIHEHELPEELAMKGKSQIDFIQLAFSTWERIVDVLLPFKDRSFDLILFPEIIVPFQGEAPLFLLEDAKKLLEKLDITSPIAPVFTRDGELFVSSYSIAQSLSNRFSTPLLIGLEGAEFDAKKRKMNYFNSAYFITPNKSNPKRYDKEILLPMAEYIPFDWLKPLAARYGLFDSFKKGDGAKIFVTDKAKIGSSVCYEDTFSGLMRKNKKAGATLLTNLTNDGWYPDSLLAKEHLELARLRTVENGLPLLRACNFGISGGIDSLGKTVKLVPYSEIPVGIHAFPIEISTYSYDVW